MELEPHNLSKTAEASLIQDGAKPGLFGIFHLQEGVISLFSVFDKNHVLDGDILPRPLGYLD